MSEPSERDGGPVGVAAFYLLEVTWGHVALIGGLFLAPFQSRTGFADIFSDSAKKLEIGAAFVLIRPFFTSSLGGDHPA